MYQIHYGSSLLNYREACNIILIGQMCPFAYNRCNSSYPSHFSYLFIYLLCIVFLIFSNTQLVLPKPTRHYDYQQHKNGIQQHSLALRRIEIADWTDTHPMIKVFDCTIIQLQTHRTSSSRRFPSHRHERKSGELDDIRNRNTAG